MTMSWPFPAAASLAVTPRILLASAITNIVTDRLFQRQGAGTQEQRRRRATVDAPLPSQLEAEGSQPKAANSSQSKLRAGSRRKGALWAPVTRGGWIIGPAAASQLFRSHRKLIVTVATFTVCLSDEQWQTNAGGIGDTHTGACRAAIARDPLVTTPCRLTSVSGNRSATCVLSLGQ